MLMPSSDSFLSLPLKSGRWVVCVFTWYHVLSRVITCRCMGRFDKVVKGNWTFRTELSTESVNEHYT